MKSNTNIIFSKSTMGNIFGNSLECYDFILYGSMASFIARHFFPAGNNLVSLILTFSVFAAGFLMRPLGGIIFGYFGDTRGRRKTLLWSITLMVIPSVLLGITPSYSSIGLFAPLFIVVIRLFQGVAMGGEFAGTMTYLSELPSDRNSRGFFASLAVVGSFVGLLLGPVMIKLVNLFMTHDQFSVWGWRIPFLFSLILGIVVFLLRRSMVESPAFLVESSKKSVAKTPVKTCFRLHKSALLATFFICGQTGIPFYIVMVFSTTYFTTILHAPFAVIETQNLVTAFIVLISIPIFGWLTKKISAWVILFVASIFFILFSIIINNILIHHVLSISFYLSHLIIALFLGAYVATFPGYIASLFPTELRFSGLGISYNFTQALLCGTAPLVATAMIKHGIIIAPGIVLTVGGVMAFFALLFARKMPKY